jgi:hypothetical protein
MSELIDFGEIDLAVANYLRPLFAVRGLTPQFTAVAPAGLTQTSPRPPVIVIKDMGGGGVFEVVRDSATISIQTLAETQTEARRLASLTYTFMNAIDMTDGVLLLYSATVLGRPQPFDDDISGMARWIQSFDVEYRGEVLR